MEFIINKTVLNEGLNKVSKAISSNPVIPILSGVFLSAQENELVLIGSDSTLSIQTVINNKDNENIEVIRNGTIVLPAREFINICRAMPESEIKVSVQDKLKVKLTSGKSNFTLNGIDSKEFPRLPNVKGKGITLNGMELSNYIEKTVYAVANNQARPILTGVNFFFKSNQLGLVATDAYRLSKVVGIDYEGEEFESVVIPEKALKEIPKLLKSKVTVIKDNNLIVFKTDNDYVVTRILDGNYPETEKLIPKNYKTLLKVNRLSFLSAIERSAILSSKDKSSVTFKIDDENEGIFETIELSYTDQELGQSKENILVEGIEGEAITISFNPDFMIDALKKSDSEEIHIEFNGPMRPFVVKEVGNNRFIQLITPMR